MEKWREPVQEDEADKQGGTTVGIEAVWTHTHTEGEGNGVCWTPANAASKSKLSEVWG